MTERICYTLLGCMLLMCLCASALPVRAQSDTDAANLRQQHSEALEYNELLREEIHELNQDIDTIRGTQRWLILFVAAGAFCLGVVCGFLARRPKQTS